jgi:hypothetical protein
MSDFDEVLERLLLDPRFKAGLAVDPAAVLAGYRLSPDERALLISDFATRQRRQSLVERRASGRVMFGLAAVISEPPARADVPTQRTAPPQADDAPAPQDEKDTQEPELSNQ